MVKEKKNEEKVVKTKTERSKDRDSCDDVTCPIHGRLEVRGRTFKGYIIRKFPRRIVIEFERIIRIRKYERYAKKKTRLHARLPACMKEKVKVGDYVLIGECRPLSKLIHHVLLRKVKEAGGR